MSSIYAKRDLLGLAWLKRSESFPVLDIFEVGKDIDMEPGLVRLLFPNLLSDLTSHLIDIAHSEVTKLGQNGGVGDKINRFSEQYFSVMQQYKPALHVKLDKELIKYSWILSDLAWNTAGVVDINFSFYTRRLILSGIYCVALKSFITSKDSTCAMRIVSDGVRAASFLKKHGF